MALRELPAVILTGLKLLIAPAVADPVVELRSRLIGAVDIAGLVGMAENEEPVAPIPELAGACIGLDGGIGAAKAVPATALPRRIIAAKLLVAALYNRALKVTYHPPGPYIYVLPKSLVLASKRQALLSSPNAI